MKTLWLLFFTLLTSISHSQVTSNNTELGEVERENFSVIMALQNSELENVNRESALAGNHVFLEQIGSGNTVSSNVSSPDANIELTQRGNRNSINLHIGAQHIRYNVVQTGNDNYSFDAVFDPVQAVNLNLIQEGNNHQFERHGTNSIGNSLKFEMKGDSQTIIVRNFQ